MKYSYPFHVATHTIFRVPLPPSLEFTTGWPLPWFRAPLINQKTFVATLCSDDRWLVIHLSLYSTIFRNDVTDRNEESRYTVSRIESFLPSFGRVERMTMKREKCGRFHGGIVIIARGARLRPWKVSRRAILRSTEANKWVTEHRGRLRGVKRGERGRRGGLECSGNGDEIRRRGVWGIVVSDSGR